MTDDSIAFETKTVRAVRGLESRTISKWEGEGWEFLSRSPGKLHTELLFRRPKPKPRALLYGLLGGSAAMVLAIIIGIGVATENGDQEPASATEAATSRSASATDEQEGGSTKPVDDSPGETADSASDVLTTDNSAELRGILGLTDYCDSSIAEFATEYEGRTISFDAGIGAMTPHDGASTRYDILLSAGDFSETESPGPMFQFRDVNTTHDLHLADGAPDSLGVGTSLHVTAQVAEYETSSCLLLLEPIQTAVR